MSAAPQTDCPILDQARTLLKRRPLFLDTETTGLSHDDQVVEIAVLDSDGAVLLDSLVRPTLPIPDHATRIHGLTNADVEHAPLYFDLYPQLRDLLIGRHVVIYNASFDLRLLHQSGRAAGLAAHTLDARGFHCAMELYAEYYGGPRGRWQKLGAAMQQCGLTLPADLAPHRARADAESCRRLLLHVAAQATVPL